MNGVTMQVCHSFFLMRIPGEFDLDLRIIHFQMVGDGIRKMPS